MKRLRLLERIPNNEYLALMASLIDAGLIVLNPNNGQVYVTALGEQYIASLTQPAPELTPAQS